MLNVTGRAMLWKVENKGNYSIVQMSSSRKDKKSNTWKNSTWSFVRFVGEAHNKISQIGDVQKVRIEITNAGLSKEEYIDKEGNKAWPQNPQLVVFDFNVMGGSGEKSSSPMDTAPKVAQDENEIPWL
jgi:hypothetical protein